jgi:hypothetical protein
MPKDNVYKFRTVKWGDPERKLKMIPDAIPAELRPFYFGLMTAALCLMTFAVVYGLRAFRRTNGGRTRDRTLDLSRVKGTLSR